MILPYLLKDLQLFYGKNYLTDVLALVEDIVSCLSLLDGENGVNGGLNKSCLDLGVNVANDTCKNLCLDLGSTGAEGASDNANVSYVNILKVDLGLGACESGVTLNRGGVKNGAIIFMMIAPLLYRICNIKLILINCG